MRRIRLLLVDDHFMVRLGLSGSLASEPDFTIVGEASDGAGALRAFRTHTPDVTLLDGRLPDSHGVDVLKQMLAERPDARVVLLSVDETEEDIHRALEAGARGYLPKSLPREELLAAIRAVHAGAIHLPAAIATRLAERNRRAVLSARELEVLHLVALGHANKVIAAKLNLAEITVKVHVSHILGKLGAPDRTRATTLAIERGLVRL